VYVIKTTTTI